MALMANEMIIISFCTKQNDTRVRLDLIKLWGGKAAGKFINFHLAPQKSNM